MKFTPGARSTLAAHLLLAAIAFARPAQAQVNPPTVRPGASESVQAWARAVEAGDATALARLYTSHTVAYPPNDMVRHGSADIVAAYLPMFERYRVKVDIEDAHFLQSGAILDSWGLYRLTLTPKAGGEPVVLKGRFSDTAAQIDGRWQYIMDHASLPTP